MVAPAVRIVTSGALFRLGGGPVSDAIDRAVGDVLARGEELIKLDLYPGHGVITGQYRRGVRGELTRVRHGTIHDSNAVQGPWLEGTSSRNQSTRFKGYAMFRRAGQQLQREARDMTRARIRAATRTLNGGF